MVTLARSIKSSPLAHDAQLVKQARAVGRLESRVRRLRRDLKAATKDLRAKRRELKRYAQFIADTRRPDAAPFRMYGEHQE
jgi:hypothetical protein